MKEIFLFAFLLLITGGCKKYLEVDGPEGRIPSEEVFSKDSTANAAIAGIYGALRFFYYSPNNVTILSGLSGDELYNFFPEPVWDEYKHNNINSSNEAIPWAALYNIIYQANGAIEGLSASTTTTEKIRNHYIGESKFIRAFCYFNLVNLFGDVPLLLTTDVALNSKAKRENVSLVYAQIVKDLTDAELLLAEDVFNEQDRTRAHRSSATALLARVYLYQKDWSKAQEKAELVIHSGKYQLINDLDSFAVKDNAESIFQFAESEFDGNVEASNFIFFTSPVILCSDALLGAFEVGDARKVRWIGSNEYAGQTYYYPNKYKSSDMGDNELYTLLRLGELMLISAESKAFQNNIKGAVADLNMIRDRAGLEDISEEIDQQACLDAILHERQVELFAEVGHRWFDLKRSETVDNILILTKGISWQASDALYPIPESDIIRNRNLEQNPDY